MALVLGPASGGGGGGASTAAPPLLDAPEAIASVPAHNGSQLHFEWGAGSAIHLCEVADPAGRPGCASAVAWSAPGMEARRVAYDVLPLYRALRQALLQADNGGGGAPGARLAALRQYARSVRTVLMASAGGDDAGTAPYEAAAWHALELFFLEPDTADGCLAELYAGWLAAHGALMGGGGGAALAAAAEALRAAERPEADPGYWPTLQRLLAVGQLEAAGALLLAHSAYGADGGGPQRDALDRVYALLRSTPRLRRAGAGSTDLALLGVASDDAAAFRTARGAWGRRARALMGGSGALEAAGAVDPEGAAGLRAALAVVSGDEAALRAATSDWSELLAALLMWRYPDASPQLHLAQLLDAAVDQAGEPDASAAGSFPGFMRELLPLAAALEVQGVVRLCTHADCVGLWFVAHAYDVLRGYPRAEALLARPLPHLGCDQVEMYTLHYVETLMHGGGGDGGWLAAAEYLAWCPRYGADALEAMLARLPFSPDNPEAANKALALCARHGLSAAARSLCGRLSARALDAGLPGLALQWALRGSDAARCAALVAPVVAKLAAQLDARATSFEAAPLDLPELDELAPLLDTLPPLPAWEADQDAAATATGGASGGMAAAASQATASTGPATTFRHQQERRGGGAAAAAAAAAAKRAGARGGGHGGRVAYAELQFLRSFSKLQTALRALAVAAAAAGAAAAEADAEADAARAGDAPSKRPTLAAFKAAGSATAAAAAERRLAAAYAAARRPLMEALGLPLAPPALRVPLLRFALPLLESSHAPFTRADGRRLLRVLGASLGALAAARCDGLPADDGGSGGGGAGGAADGGGSGSAAVAEVRLALARALARAHIAESSRHDV